MFTHRWQYFTYRHIHKNIKILSTFDIFLKNRKFTGHIFMDQFPILRAHVQFKNGQSTSTIVQIIDKNDTFPFFIY